MLRRLLQHVVQNSVVFVSNSGLQQGSNREETREDYPVLLQIFTVLAAFYSLRRKFNNRLKLSC